MPSLTCFSLHFTPSWRTIFFANLFILLFMRLGFWQIQRAHEKQRMIQAQLAQNKKQFTLWNGKHSLAQYQRIRIRGHFLTYVFLLDNQHYQHQFGYDVLSPFMLADGKVILVDRGFLPDNSNRQKLPKIPINKAPLELKGSIYFPSKNPWILGEGFEIKDSKLAVIEMINFKVLHQILQKNIYPFIMRLDKQNEHGFIREWDVVSMPSERHLGYAFQWFAMALSTFILFIFLNLKKYNE